MRPRQRTGLVGHRQQHLSAQGVQLSGERFGGQTRLRPVQRRTMSGHVLGVVALVRGGAQDQRHQQTGHTGRAQLADRDRASAADDQVAGRQPRGHVFDERQDLGLDAMQRISCAHRIELLRTGLVHDPRPLLGRQQRQRGRQGLVEHLRAQAATHDQQLQRPAAAGKSLGRRRQRLDLGTHRVAGDQALPDRRGRTLEAKGHAVGEPQQDLVRQQQRSVRIDQQQRLAQQAGHQASGQTHIAAHAQHRAGTAPAQHGRSVPESPDQPQATAQAVQQALATHAAESQAIQRDTGRRDQTVLHAVGGAEPTHAPAATLQFAGDRDTGDDVAASASGHDHEVGHHARPPRIN